MPSSHPSVKTAPQKYTYVEAHFVLDGKATEKALIKQLHEALNAWSISVDLEYARARKDGVLVGDEPPDPSWCEACEGTGKNIGDSGQPKATSDYFLPPCPTCKGTGKK